MVGEAENMDDMADLDATQITPESVVADITGLGDDPSTPALQKILNDIAAVEDDSYRLLLFTEAIRLLKGALKEMAKKMQSQASKDWKDYRKKPYGKGGEKREAGKSDIPLPSWGTGFGLHHGRTYVVGPPFDGAEFEVPLHSPLRIISAAKYLDRTVQGRGNVQGVLVEFENLQGKSELMAFPRAAALSNTAHKEGMIQDLANAGVGFTKHGIARFQELVMAVGGLDDNAEVVDYPGWRGDVFITPGGDVIGETNKHICLSKPLAGIKAAGTLEGWCKATAAAFCPIVLKKAPQIPAALLFGFTSPLADRAKEPMSFIMCLAGKTTRLKTYSLREMASIWGMTLPTEDEAVLITFNTTPAKMEENAVERSGCGLAIDDSTLIEATKLGPFCYRLTTGAEKGRFKEKRRRWSIACVITSEVPIEQYLKEGGYQPPPGLMSRVIEIPIQDDRVEDAPINQLDGAFENFGHAGPAFVQAMFNGGWDEKKIKVAIKDRLARLLGGTGTHEQSRRAARGVAFIWLAGDIAKDAGLVPVDFDVEQFTKDLWELVRRGADTHNKEVSAVIHALAAGLQNGSIPIHSDKGFAQATAIEVSGVLCDQHFDHDGKVFPAFVLTIPALARYLGARITVKDGAKSLEKESLLIRQQDDRYVWKEGRTGVGNVPSYVLPARGVLGDRADEIISEIFSARKGQGPKLNIVAGPAFKRSEG